MTQEAYYYLAFSHVFGIGPMKFTRLLDSFSSAKKAYEAPFKELKEVIGEKTAMNLEEFRSIFDPVKEFRKMAQKEISFLPRNDPRFPAALRNISDCPIGIYLRGNPKTISFNNDLFFGIVGTRNCTSYGEKITKKFSYEMAQAGFVIVSGLAKGVDVLAHSGALLAKKKTIAVLGCGVDICSPPVNRGVYEEIINSNGLIMSEFPPGHFVLKGLFVSRNRLISGLSKGVLVIEGTKDSGALITAKYALDQGKEVFATPGQLTSQYSQAPTILLKQGSKLVTSIEDILEEFKMKIVPQKKIDISAQLSYEEKLIFNELLKEPQLADELGMHCSLPIYKILSIITSLEIKNVVEKNSEGRYQIK